MITEKKCTICDLVKPLNMFLFKNKKENKRHSSCKDCYKQIRKKSYEKNKNYYYEKNKRRRNEINEWFFNLKSKLECSICGENHVATLDFHHDDDNKEDNVSTILRKTMNKERALMEIKKCTVLCSNCHRKLHYEEKR